ncbi:hypothetical protein HY546_03715 [archaeon]|nr:hypothetical protein [archaeon]
MAIKVAKTLAEIWDDPDVRDLHNRRKNATPALRRIMDEWRADLDKRQPAAIYSKAAEGEDRIYGGTDLDWATAVVDGAQRRAVWNLPTYERIRPKERRPDERVFEENRHGKVFCLMSNERSWAFHIGMVDVNVVRETPWGDVIGWPRYFAITDDEGNLNLREVELDPAFYAYADERELGPLETIKLPLHHLVLRDLALAIYGRRFITTMMAARRAHDGGLFYKRLAVRLRGMGLRLPEDKMYKGHAKQAQGAEEGAEYQGVEQQAAQQEEQKEAAAIAKRKPPKPKKWPSERVSKTNLAIELDMPPFEGSYPCVGIDIDGELSYKERTLPKPSDTAHMQAVLRYSERVGNELLYRTGRTLRAAVRSVAFAAFHYGGKGRTRLETGGCIERYPWWNVGKWEPGYLFSINPDTGMPTQNPKTEWNALRISESPRLVLLHRVYPERLEVPAAPAA